VTRVFTQRLRVIYSPLFDAPGPRGHGLKFFGGEKFTKTVQR
jgi:hypothetical protein